MDVDLGPFVFRINDNGAGPDLLLQVCAERGWREYAGDGCLRDHWNLWWRTNGFPSSLCRSLKHWQYTNHIPNSSSICRKDKLARHLRLMRNVYGNVYDFSPSVYNLPLEYNKLVAECSRSRMAAAAGGGCGPEDDVWICKPVGQSRGRGIYLFRKLSELTYGASSVVQRYIPNPLLIGGYKCDLRLYVCVPSYRPLAVYLYREGLVRFSTAKFSLADLGNLYCHLTNSSLNKQGPGYSVKKERVGSGCKWTLRQLRRYLRQSDAADWLLWQRVAAIVVLTVLAQAGHIAGSTNCFEFFGFDVLVDNDLRPWLLEVNLSPALNWDCDVDGEVKKPLLHDLFDLLGLPVRRTGLSMYTALAPPASPPAAPRPAARRKLPPAAVPADPGDPVLGRWKGGRRRASSGCSSSDSDAGAGARRRGRRRSGSPPVYCILSVPGLRVSRLGPRPDPGPPPPSTPPPPPQPPVPALRVTSLSRDGDRPSPRSTARTQRCRRLREDGLDAPMLQARGAAALAAARRQPPSLWGNGKDWRRPAAAEGDWVRVFPLCGPAAEAAPEGGSAPLTPSEREVRRAVTQISKLVRTARDVARRYVGCNDADRNQAFSQALGLSGEVWLPHR